RSVPTLARRGRSLVAVDEAVFDRSGVAIARAGRVALLRRRLAAGGVGYRDSPRYRRRRGGRVGGRPGGEGVLSSAAVQYDPRPTRAGEHGWSDGGAARRRAAPRAQDERPARIPPRRQAADKPASGARWRLRQPLVRLRERLPERREAS